MRTRVGVELSPLSCRIVELEGALGSSGLTRVRSFDRLARLGVETHARLAALHNRDVAVVAWGLRSDQRQLVVSSGSYGRMRREAVAAARDAGLDTRGMVVDIASTARRRRKRQAVVTALAGMQDLAAILQRLRRVGARVRSIVTPPLALMSLARVRDAAPSHLIDVYVALEETTTALAAIQDDMLIEGRELAWGYQNEVAEVRPREDVAATLARELDAFFEACGFGRSSVAQIAVCGGLPGLRNMAMSLMQRMDIEVEPLDSLSGIDEDALMAEAFRDHAADLRVAWVVAADWHAPINLLRERDRRQRQTVRGAAAVAAGVVAGPALLWTMFRRDSGPPNPPAHNRRRRRRRRRLGRRPLRPFRSRLFRFSLRILEMTRPPMSDRHRLARSRRRRVLPASVR